MREGRGGEREREREREREQGRGRKRKRERGRGGKRERERVSVCLCVLMMTFDLGGALMVQMQSTASSGFTFLSSSTWLERMVPSAPVRSN